MCTCIRVPLHAVLAAGSWAVVVATVLVILPYERHVAAGSQDRCL